MSHKILLEKDSKTVNNPKHLQGDVFSLYSSRKFTIEPAANEKIDTVTAFLPKISREFITSKFRTDEINELFYGKHRLWLEILNKCFQDNIEIKKDILLVSLSLSQKT